MKRLLLIFVKDPIKGQVKTRLAVGIGEENALSVYKQLLTYTKDIVQYVETDIEVHYSNRINDNDLWNDYTKHLQSGDTLGDRMEKAFANGFEKGFEQVVIIGSDCADIESSHIQNAFEALDKNNMVLGPAEDGGYYLLGMNKLYRDIFSEKSWSTANLFEETLYSISELGLSSYLLPRLSDIDTVNDLKNRKNYEQYLPGNHKRRL